MKKHKATADGISVFCAHDKIVSIGELKPNPRNPNHHPAGQIELLKKIIRENGWRNPITVSARSGYIVKGHGRLAAAKEMAVEFVPVDFQDYESDQHELADLIADNRISELSEMSSDGLRNLLDELGSSEFDLEIAGFDPAALDEMMMPQDEELPDLSEKISAKLGIIIEVDGEAEQKKLYLRFEKEGLKCRLLSL
jgi:ParB-like chromosome segregation protein Spo0J